MAMDFLQLLPLGDASSSSSVQAAGSGQGAARASAAPQDEDSTIDDLMRLIEDGPGVGPCRDQDVDELLRSLQPKEGSPLLRPSAAPGSPKSLVLEGEDQQELAVVHDLPEPHEQLPPDVFPVPFIYVCKFNARCELDLKQIAFGIRHAEYNPRKHSSITVRLFNPCVTALIRASGAITLSANAGCASEDDLKRSAKKLARLIQRCGHDSAKFADFAVTSILCKATLGFPVRLDVLASRFRKNALYEPEFFCSCVFRTRQPRCTFLVTPGGKVSICGLRSIEEVKEALRRAYFVFREFRT